MLLVCLIRVSIERKWLQCDVPNLYGETIMCYVLTNYPKVGHVRHEHYLSSATNNAKSS